MKIIKRLYNSNFEKFFSYTVRASSLVALIKWASLLSILTSDSDLID